MPTLPSIALALLFSTLAVQEVAIPVQRDRNLKLYEVRDIVRAHDWMATDSDENPEEREAEGSQRLCRIVRSYMQPPPRDPEQDVRCTPHATLIVLGTDEQHAWLDRFLRLQRDSAGLLIDMQARFVDGPRGAFGELGVEGSTSILESSEDVRSFLARIAEDERFTTVTSPRLIFFGRNPANIEVFDPVSYVKEWRLEIVQPGGREVADPVIETIQEGFSLSAMAVLLDEERFGLEIEIRHAQVARPIPTRTVRIGATGEGEVAEPRVTRLSLDSNVVLAAGGLAVFVMPGEDEARDRAVLVRVDRAAADELDRIGEQGERR